MGRLAVNKFVSRQGRHTVNNAERRLELILVEFRLSTCMAPEKMITQDESDAAVIRVHDWRPGDLVSSPIALPGVPC